MKKTIDELIQKQNKWNYSISKKTLMHYANCYNYQLEYYEAVFNNLNLEKNSSILDVCCGLPTILDLFENSYCNDLGRDLVAFTYSLGYCDRILKMDCRQLSNFLKEKSFDYVFSSGYPGLDSFWEYGDPTSSMMHYLKPLVKKSLILVSPWIDAKYVENIYKNAIDLGFNELEIKKIDFQRTNHNYNIFAAITTLKEP